MCGKRQEKRQENGRGYRDVADAVLPLLAVLAATAAAWMRVRLGRKARTCYSLLVTNHHAHLGVCLRVLVVVVMGLGF